jgi:hypothetical protein
MSEIEYDFLEVEEDRRPELGTEDYYNVLYNESVETFVKDFLHKNVDEILKTDCDDQKKKEQLDNLISVYFNVRTEFEKHKSKLMVKQSFSHLWHG